MIVLLPGIPIYSIIVRYNLVESNICKPGWANFWGVLFPWLLSIPVRRAARRLLRAFACRGRTRAEPTTAVLHGKRTRDCDQLDGAVHQRHHQLYHTDAAVYCGQELGVQCNSRWYVVQHLAVVPRGLIPISQVYVASRVGHSRCADSAVNIQRDRLPSFSEAEYVWHADSLTHDISRYLTHDISLTLARVMTVNHTMQRRA